MSLGAHATGGPAEVASGAGTEERPEEAGYARAMSQSAAPPVETLDVVVVGASAAGLMAACSAGRAAPGARVVALEGARKVGAKIRVSGGGRCNVTHEAVTARDFAGSKRRAIDRVLKRFRVADTREFFADQGVELVREENGKLFPRANTAKVVVQALVDACREAGAQVRTAHRVEEVLPVEGGFELRGSFSPLRARRVVLATGGKALPKSGSDGWGLELATRLGHTLTPHVLPALVPLTLPAGHPLTRNSGIAVPSRLVLKAATGKVLERVEGATLITHVGLSGPAILDVSRHYLLARAQGEAATLHISWLPDQVGEDLDARLQQVPSRSVVRTLSAWLPRRLIETLLELAGASHDSPDALPRVARRRLVEALVDLRLPIDGDLGYRKAEVTAGGVPLDQLDLKTMESRRCPGLHMAGEILDVDGRIGGFNFQWAWASGWVAGEAAARSCMAG